MSRGAIKNLSSGVPTGSDTNRAVQPQKMARGLYFQVLKVEGLYYLCSENKGANQLCGYPAQLICAFVCADAKKKKKTGFLVTRLNFFGIASLMRLKRVPIIHLLSKNKNNMTHFLLKIAINHSILHGPVYVM